ncbi:hypothetical protein VaNZ11_014962, partial [Volvox africanus]
PLPTAALPPSPWRPPAPVPQWSTPAGEGSGAGGGVARIELWRRLMGQVTAAVVFAAGSDEDGGLDDGCAPSLDLRLRLGLGLLALAALALRSKARSWRAKLPAELVAAAVPGQPCCLFWPPPSSRPNAAVVAWLGHRAPLQRAVRRALAPVASVTSQVLSRLGRGAYDVLKAMDVPADQLVISSGTAAAVGDNAGSETEEPSQQTRSPTPQPPPPPPPPAAATAIGSAAAGSNRGKREEGVSELQPGAVPATEADDGGAAAAAAGDVGEMASLSPLQPYGTKSGISFGTRISADGGVCGGGPSGGASFRRRHTRSSRVDDIPSRLLVYLQLLAHFLMETCEHMWEEWGGEVSLLSLLLAAFTCCSVLSLLLLAALGSGMAASPPFYAALRRHAVLPMLGAVLLYQYAAWVGLPRLVLPGLGRPPPYPVPSDAAHLPPVLAAWLGLQNVGPLVPWALFVALAACLMQVNTDLGKLQEQNRHPQQRLETVGFGDSAGSQSLNRRSRGWVIGDRGGLWCLPFRRKSWSVETRPPQEEGETIGSNDLEAPLLPPAMPPPLPPPLLPLPSPRSGGGGRPFTGAEGDGGGGGGGGWCTMASAVHGARQRPEPIQIPQPGQGLGRVQRMDKGGRSYGGGAGDVRLFSPMASWAQLHWGVLDWCRYYLVRHAADVLLVALVGLVALQRDLLRAGYLAHCLLLFRRRPELSAPGGAGGALFGRLVGFNFLVLLLEGVFQAPWELLLGAAWARPCSLAAPSPDDSGDTATPACTFPRLVGLCRLQPGRLNAAAGNGMWSPWSALADSPVVADVVVWLLLRLYVRVLRSRLFARVAAVAAAAQQQHVAALRQEAEHAREAAARGALAASHARAVRKRRIAMLKVLLLSPSDTAPTDGPARAGDGDDDGYGGGAAALVAYYRALHGSGPVGGSRGGSGGGGGGGPLLVATGGGPQVAGLADLLDDDIDLSDVAVAWAAGLDSGGHQRSNVRRPSHRPFYFPGQHPEMRHRSGGLRSRGHGLGGGGGFGGRGQEPSGGSVGAFGRASSLSHDLLAQGLPESTGAHSLTPRRTQSYGDLKNVGHDTETFPCTSHPDRAAGAAAAAAAAAAVATAAAAGPPMSAARLPGAPAAEISQYAQQRSGGLSAVHRRFASADILTPTEHEESSRQVKSDGSGALTKLDVLSAAAAAPLPCPTDYKGSSSRGRGGGGGGGADRRPPSPRLSWPPFLVWLYGKIVAPLAAATQRRRLDDDSFTCYVSYMLLFLADMSLLAAVMPLSMLLYSLLLERKPRQYWQAALLYAEGVLILQYSYLVLGNCLCATDVGAVGDPSCMWIFGRRDFMYRVQVLGLHSEPSRCLLLFITYLATLMHSYSLDTVYAAVAPPPVQQDRQAAVAAMAPAPRSRIDDAGGIGQALSASASPPLMSFRWLRWRLRCGAGRIQRLVRHLAHVYGTATSQHEVGPYWVNLHMALPGPHQHQRTRALPQPSPQPQPQRPGPQPTEEPAPAAVRAERSAGLPPRPQPPPMALAVTGIGTGKGIAQQACTGPQPDVAAAPASLKSTPATEVEGAEGTHVYSAASALPEAELGVAAPREDVAAAAGTSATLPGEMQSSRPGIAGSFSCGMVLGRQLADTVQAQGPQIVDAIQQLLTAVYEYGRLTTYRKNQEAMLQRQQRRRQRQQSTTWQVAEWAEEVGSDDSGDGEGDEGGQEEVDNTAERWRSAHASGSGVGDSGAGRGEGGATVTAAPTTSDDAGSLATSFPTSYPTSSATADAAIARFAHYSLPQLRLQHGPLPSRTAVHVLLEVVTPVPPALAAAEGDADALQASPTPAHDVAVVLRYSSETLRRQRQPAPVPLFKRLVNGAGAVVGGAAESGRGSGRGGGGVGAGASHGSRVRSLPQLPPPLPGLSPPTTPAELAPSPKGAAALPTASSVTDNDQPRSGNLFLRGPSAAASTSADGGLRQRRVQSPVVTHATGGGSSVGSGPVPSLRRQRSVSAVGSATVAYPDAPLSPPAPAGSPPLPPLPPKLQLPDPPGLPTILSVESYSKPPQDLYGPTAVLDLISFMYALVFYQFVVFSARSLADITDGDRRLPLDYLAALMLLFGIMVSERAVYMLGWPAA